MTFPSPLHHCPQKKSPALFLPKVSQHLQTRRRILTCSERGGGFLLRKRARADVEGTRFCAKEEVQVRPGGRLKP